MDDVTREIQQEREEAERERNGRTAYLFKSKVIEAYYLFIPVVEDVAG